MAEINQAPVRIYVLSGSMYGHSRILGEAVAAGAAEAENTEVIFRDVDEIEPEQLRSADGIIWGCGGVFGEPNSKMTAFFSRLGKLWATGALQGKVGGVFGTNSMVHYGLENLLRSLQTPMQHQGMIIVTNCGQLTPERVQYGCPYGAGASIPSETSREAPINHPRQEELEFAREYGRKVAEVASRLKS